MTDDFDASLLIAFGGPNNFDEVRPFLDNVLRGHPVLPARYEKVVEQYKTIGGSSPLTQITFRQSDALSEVFEAKGINRKVYVGMRNWSPYLKDTISKMAGDHVRRALAIVMAPHRAEASWERYRQSVSESMSQIPLSKMEIRYCGPWHTNPLFIESIADRARETVRSHEIGKDTYWIFTAHSIPLEMDKKSGYSTQVMETAKAVSNVLGLKEWCVCYQSRSGQPDHPWLEPDVNQKIRDLSAAGTRAIVAVPAGFVCDHVEVLYDLDVQARNTAEELGIVWQRARTVGDHPKFIQMLSELS